MAVDGESPSAAMADRFRFLMTSVTGLFLVTYSAILTVPGSANAMTASAPGEVMAVRRGSAVAFFTGGFLIVANQAKLLILV